ncbi:MAG TPA: PhzF family phenazine biosynthesis protein [Xanthobacteraceae bacterium]|nr:PhzF family phenazine biosynthesis protein [Xanthobacteraceae bacterium]
MKLPFATLDVFTERRYAGNPLAVVFDADALDGAAMQAIAREFSHPETVFVLRPEQPGSTARVRIFTPATELAFAGHPTVGAALALALKGRSEGGKVLLEEKVGLIDCAVEATASDRGRARFRLPALPAPDGEAAESTAIAAALGLAPDDIGSNGFAPARWTLGNTFTFVPLRDIDAVRRCRINDRDWDKAFERGGRSFAFVFCRETVDPGSHFHARMFAPRAGVPEDPATGSAAAAFAGLCAQALALEDGEHRLLIEQGYEMGRPSLIELQITMRDGELAVASIGGPAIIVTEGTIEA